MTSIMTTADRAAPSHHLALFNFFYLGVALALAGAVMGFLSLTANSQGAVPTPTASIGTSSTTSYGSLVVAYIETIDGPNDEMFGGMSHGIADVVLPDEARVAVSVLVVNESDDTVLFEADQFAVFAEGSTEAIVPSTSTVQAQLLQPGSSIEGTVTFVIPLTGAELSVAYADPGGAVIVVPAGRLSQPSADATTHDHHAVEGAS